MQFLFLVLCKEMPEEVDEEKYKKYKRIQIFYTEDGNIQIESQESKQTSLLHKLYKTVNIIIIS